MKSSRRPRMGAAGLLAVFSLLLTSCFMTPGKFESELVLTGENEFSFTYEGEIVFVGLSDLDDESEKSFTPECFDDDTGETRECTQIEIDDQRANWEVDQQMRQQERQQMAAMMGDIDLDDPEASEALRQVMLRQKGWERVEITDKGVFNVTYRTTGTLSHDFMFPVIESVPTTNPFVQIIVRDAGLVRVDAPGFGEGNEMNSMMAGFGAASLAEESAGTTGEASKAMAKLPKTEGTFRIVTDGTIRANNTDEGPTSTARGEQLEWEVTTRTKAAPTALIQLSE